MESFSVLVVEPDSPNRNALVRALKERSWNIDTAASVSEAMGLLNKVAYNVAVFSMNLPDMEGADTVAEIKKIQPDVIVFMAADRKDALDGLPRKGVCMFLRGPLDTVEVEEIINAGAPACFLKPFDVETLLAEIQAIVNKRNEERQCLEASSSKILFVEDNENIRKTTQYMLEAEGFSVKTAATLQEGIELIKQETFNLVISDLSLAGSSGLSLIDPVRKKDSSTVFLIMTGRASMETALEAIKKDVDEYILKPIEPRELINKIKSYLDKQRILKEKDALMRQLKESNAKLLKLIKTDELTGVLNRRYLFEQLYHEMQRSKRQNKPLGIMMCDVDGFKKYNDTHGHLEGDKLLKEIARLLQVSVREYVDQVFRYGGDEFAVTVPEVSREEALEIADRIVSNVSENFKGKGIGMSIGLAFFEPAAKKIMINDFLHAADKNLYKAKKLGGNRAVV